MVLKEAEAFMSDYQAIGMQTTVKHVHQGQWHSPESHRKCYDEAPFHTDLFLFHHEERTIVPTAV